MKAEPDSDSSDLEDVEFFTNNELLILVEERAWVLKDFQKQLMSKFRQDHLKTFATHNLFVINEENFQFSTDQLEWRKRKLCSLSTKLMQICLKINKQRLHGFRFQRY